MTYLQRSLLAAACIVTGFLFFPLFFVGGFIAWTVYRDVSVEPERKIEELKASARGNALLTVEEMRWACDSPAETAFLDAMVSAFNLQSGPGAVEGSGLRLRNQVSIGQLNISSNSVSYQYRADFVIDDKLVVEIDGASYHSSPDAVSRDQQRDADMRREGYSILRLPAQIVFQNPDEALKRVKTARKSL